MYTVMEEIERVRERNRREYEGLAEMTGKTIAEIEEDLTAPDPGMEGPHKEDLHKLSNRMVVEFDNGNIVLYDTRAHSAGPTSITSEEMSALSVLYADGRCPACLGEIPEGDIVCDECLGNARAARWLSID